MTGGERSGAHLGNVGPACHYAIVPVSLDRISYQKVLLDKKREPNIVDHTIDMWDP